MLESPSRPSTRTCRPRQKKPPSHVTEGPQPRGGEGGVGAAGCRPGQAERQWPFSGHVQDCRRCGGWGGAVKLWAAGHRRQGYPVCYRSFAGDEPARAEQRIPDRGGGTWWATPAFQARLQTGATAYSMEAESTELPPRRGAGLAAVIPRKRCAGWGLHRARPCGLHYGPATPPGSSCARADAGRAAPATEGGGASGGEGGSSGTSAT